MFPYDSFCNIQRNKTERLKLKENVLFWMPNLRCLQLNVLECMAQSVASCCQGCYSLRLPWSTFASPTPEFQTKCHKMEKTQVVASCIKPKLRDIVNVLNLEDPGQTERELNYLDQLPYF